MAIPFHELLLAGSLLGIAALLASYAARLTSKPARIASLTTLSAPGLLVAAIALRAAFSSEPSLAPVLLGLAAIWLAPIAAGAWWERIRAVLDRRWWFGRWLLLFVPILVAMGFAAAFAAADAHRFFEKRQEEQRKLRLEWAAAERRRSACVRTVTPSLALRDARASFAAEDRRLVGIYEAYQEGSSFRVPVVDGFKQDGGAPGGVPNDIEARVEGPLRGRRFAVKASGRGESWQDPWFFVSGSMGRPPNSAAACTRATEAYAASYNRAMLRLLGEVVP